MRRVHVNGVEWLYSVGRGGGVVIRGPNNLRITTHAAHVKGQRPQDFERGQWKRTSDGVLQPSDVKRFIEVGLSLVNWRKIKEANEKRFVHFAQSWLENRNGCSNGTCETPEAPVVRAPDPYAAEIHGDMTPVDLCGPCREKRRLEV